MYTHSNFVKFSLFILYARLYGVISASGEISHRLFFKGQEQNDYFRFIDIRK